MQKNSKTQSRIVIILILIIISTFLSGIVFASPKIIHGLKPIEGTYVTCDYNPTTNNCTLSSSEDNYYLAIVGDAQIFVVDAGVETPNLIIDANVTINTYCVKLPDSEGDCINQDANLNITDFNSIVVSPNNSVTIAVPEITNTKISGDIIIHSGADFFFSQSSDINRCIDINSSDPNYSAKLTLSNIDFSEANIKINANGSLNFHSQSGIYAATSDDENICTTGVINDENVSLEVINKKKIEFGNIYNNGNLHLACSVIKKSNSVEDVELINPICDITINNIEGVFPNYIGFDNDVSDNQEICFGITKLSTCGLLDIPSEHNYLNICKLVYIRDSNAYTNLNQQNTGIDNDKIISLVRSCNNADINKQIAHYLFTSKSQIKSNPIIFGTINSAITKQPIDITLQVNDNNQGLYNINNLNQSVSPIQNQENTFFRISPNNFQNGVDVNLLDTYIFRFKLLNNPTVGYSDIKLDYPFKIHK